MTLQRIAVVGTTGSGKTAMARRISERLDVPHVELDALNFGPNWTMRPDDVFLALVDEATQGQRWVLDGNYSRARGVIWPRADTIVRLDYALPIILWRLWWRTLRRITGREILWHGNRESARTHFLSRESLFLWALQTYRRRRREYPAHLKAPEHAHLKLIHHRSPRQADRWLSNLALDSPGARS